MGSHCTAVARDWRQRGSPGRILIVWTFSEMARSRETPREMVKGPLISLLGPEGWV